MGNSGRQARATQWPTVHFIEQAATTHAHGATTGSIATCSSMVVGSDHVAMPSSTVTTANVSSDILQRMVDAVERVRQRLLRATTSLRVAGVDYATLGGNAVAAWVGTIDSGGIRNTPDVDILIRRGDFEAVKAALEAVGFRYTYSANSDMFLDHPGSSPRQAVRLIFANELVRAGEPAANPDVTEATDMGSFRVLNLDALVRIKLTAFRRKDQVHLLDLIGVGLIDSFWPSKLPPVLANRLQELLDTPDG